MKFRVRQPDMKVRAMIEKNELGIRVTTTSGAVADLEYAGIRKLDVAQCLSGLAICLSPAAIRNVLDKFRQPGFKYEYAG